jgi:serine-type D-Ala-D-Ala carboxypeptidase (penicillin-binding protein 5/6)
VAAAFGAFAQPAPGAQPEPPSSLPAASWILVDADSQDVLASQDSSSAYPVASATKLMTYYVASGQLRPSREIVVAPYDPKPGESLAGFEPGDTVTARDAFYGLLVPSGNDAALTLALAVSGSESDFVARMNNAADALGLAETTYLDSIGLNAGNVSSARDLVDLASELRKQELFRQIVDTPRITLRSPAQPIRVLNRNALVLEEPFVDGIKTGTTVEAGYVLVASGTQQGIGLVSVVLGAPDEASRDSATLDLLEYGFSLYDKRTLVKEGERLGFTRLADGGRLPLAAAKPVTEVARADQEIDVRLSATTPVAPPVAEGEPVAVAAVRLDGQKVGEVDALAVRAVAGLPEPERNDTGLPAWAWIVFGVAAAVALLFALLAVRVHRRE